MSKKCTVTIGKKFTINTGNYSSIQPSLSITINNVNIEKIKEIHELGESIVDILFHKQIFNDSDLIETIKKMGIDEYSKNVDKSEMDNVLKDNIRAIDNHDFFISEGEADIK